MGIAKPVGRFDGVRGQREGQNLAASINDDCNGASWGRRDESLKVFEPADGESVYLGHEIARQEPGLGRHPTRNDFDAALMRAIDCRAPKLVVLAGFMRILTDNFINHYKGRFINIHPSLLPAFPGLNTHQRAIEANAKQHGATVHFVDAIESPRASIAPAAASSSPPTATSRTIRATFPR